MKNLILANRVINTYAYEFERISIITPKYEKSTYHKWAVNLIVWLKILNLTGPKPRQSESKIMFQSQMMKNYGISTCVMCRTFRLESLPHFRSTINDPETRTAVFLNMNELRLYRITRDQQAVNIN